MPAPAAPDTVGMSLADGLRREVGWLRQVDHRRVFAARLHLGEPGRPRSICSDPLAPLSGPPWPLPTWLDAGARRDVCERLAGQWAAESGGPTRCWLTRPGAPAPHDEDLAWLAAARWALGAYDLPLRGFWVVTRYGWLDPDTGEGRSWKRLRLHRPT